jgi:hypothetical protein
MSPKEFVHAIHKDVVAANVSTYGALLASTPPDGATDPNWSKALAIYQSLDENARRAFLGFVRQIMLDTTSNLLGVLDGSSPLDAFRDEFKLTYGGSAQPLNGDLQSLLLELDQDDQD